ncbi:hypothetical protein J3F84DRAFT_310397 [Trichoderma pleuroticola]|uniref:DUF4440 domain-containing protein n=1 Tax=Trichoderma harzianum TaxID=5544 RepID=A0A2K0UQH6_TRIHA|nr:hypothetical protein THARTR1_00051 [Trichoderma harzianum]
MADEKEAALATVQKFLNSISLRQPPFSEALEDVLPDGWCVLSHPDEFWVGRFKDLVPRIEEKVTKSFGDLASKFEERLAEPGPEVWIHEDLAAVWAGYGVYVDNKEISRGINLFGLHKTADGWKISGVADTQLPEGPERSPVLQTVSPEVMKPIDYFLDNMTKGDWDKIPSVLVMDSGITNSRRKDNMLRTSTWAELLVILKGIVDKSPIEIRELLFDVETRICGDFAFAWTPFVIDINGQTVNKGVNIFTLVKKEGEWIISGCQDTSLPVE